ncbi:pyridoxamine 5'-phosphate oxidase family protein [Saccharopolyspora sp. NFXS83]|uniref:MSMEG_1061 family FMN-dependent PPOX-type flavoprotein n=1 Tax=Saccharopolyspora sp. NFXS83 TaxID=2993560 RepID=UPI00224B8FD3|nr:MSMEG_1061 family FMN-dependent PPOX-type flavoprotein [Saccharopolyspora sp. NFXS83]MCX2734316.1 pyridoxamine 5'-phosphate oxidase family protein [Saccharopolyspora sp. NFXS83]
MVETGWWGRVHDETTGIAAVSSDAELRELVKEPHPAIAEKSIDRVDEQSCLFLSASPFFLLATTSSDGSLDVSPRGDPAGGVLVEDEGRTLVFADRPGNRRLDSLHNILRHPQVGMLFMVPGVNDTLRVNGTATIVREAPYFERLEVEGKRPDLAISVRIDELFLHCAKAFLRSSLWDPARWPDRESVPSAGRIAKSQAGAKVPERVLNAALKLDARWRR